MPRLNPIVVGRTGMIVLSTFSVTGILSINESSYTHARVNVNVSRFNELWVGRCPHGAGVLRFPCALVLHCLVIVRVKWRRKVKIAPSLAD